MVMYLVPVSVYTNSNVLAKTLVVLAYDYGNVLPHTLGYINILRISVIVLRNIL